MTNVNETCVFKSYETLDAELLDDGILVLRLNRPDAMNAFTVEMADELEAFFTSVNDDDAVRAIVVTGAGKAFCAGMDLRREGNVFGLDETLRPTLADMRERLNEPAIERGVRDTGGRVTLAIHACRKPVIAAINGAAAGIGATMTLAMDFRLAATDARIGLVFSRIGITPEACSSWFLPRLVGLQRALEWVYCGDILSADEAFEGGLLHSLHEREALLEAAVALARRITRNKSAVSVALIRQMLMRNAGVEHPLAAHEVDSLAMFYTSINDGKEGVASFLEKRAPQFKGKASEMPEFYAEWSAAD